MASLIILALAHVGIILILIQHAICASDDKLKIELVGYCILIYCMVTSCVFILRLIGDYVKI